MARRTTGGSDHAQGQIRRTGDRHGPTERTSRSARSRSRLGRDRGQPRLGDGPRPSAGRAACRRTATSGLCAPRSPGRPKSDRPGAAGRRRSACRCLVAVGGDGTVSALVNERPSLPITVLPAGTENLVARHFGLRRDPHGLAGTIAAGRSVPVDVGQAAGRRFLLMAGFGFDADVVTRHHRGAASPARDASGRPTGSPTSSRSCGPASPTGFPTISVRIVDPGAEEVLRGTTVFVFNLPRYALGFPSSRSPARTTAGSTWSSSATRARSRRSTTSGRSSAASTSTIRASTIGGSGRVDRDRR